MQWSGHKGDSFRGWYRRSTRTSFLRNTSRHVGGQTAGTLQEEGKYTSQPIHLEKQLLMSNQV